MIWRRWQILIVRGRKKGFSPQPRGLAATQRACVSIGVLVKGVRQRLKRLSGRTKGENTLKVLVVEVVVLFLLIFSTIQENLYMGQG